MLVPSIVVTNAAQAGAQYGRTSIMCTLLIPDYDPQDPQSYPGDIKPGIYEDNEIVDLLRQHSHNPEAIYFIADLLED
jgi:hypothetical protein